MAIGTLAATAFWIGGLLQAGTVTPSRDAIVAGADAGANAVRLFDGSGPPPYDFSPYPAGYAGGVRVAAGDVNGDGTTDLIVAPGDGSGPNVRVFSGASGALIDSFDAYAPTFLGGVYVAAGDVNGDGRADIVTGAGAAVGATPHVKVFDGRSGSELRAFLAYEANFAGGVTVAAGDLNGDGLADVITGAASASAAHVKVFDGRTGAELRSFFAYPMSFTGGVFVAGGDYDGDGRADIVTGAGPGAAPHVKVFDAVTQAERASFFAYSPMFVGGVRVATADVNGDGRADLITAPGAGMAPSVARFLGPTGSSDGAFLAFDAGFTGGVFVAGALPMPTVFRDGFEPE